MQHRNTFFIFLYKLQQTDTESKKSLYAWYHSGSLISIHISSLQNYTLSCYGQEK